MDLWVRTREKRRPGEVHVGPGSRTSVPPYAAPGEWKGLGFRV